MQLWRIDAARDELTAIRFYVNTTNELELCSGILSLITIVFFTKAGNSHAAAGLLDPDDKEIVEQCRDQNFVKLNPWTEYILICTTYENTDLYLSYYILNEHVIKTKSHLKAYPNAGHKDVRS